MLSESEAIQQIQTGPSFEPFSIRVRAVQPSLGQKLRLTPDFVLSLSWEGQERDFAVEYVPTGTPKRIQGAVDQARRYAGSQRSLLPMVMAPYLRSTILDWLVENGMSALDLSGNGAVVVPGAWLVLRTGSPNKFPSSAGIKNVFRGRSSMVCRALLLQGKFRSASEILQQLEPYGNVAPSTVSKVLRSLEEELLIDRDSDIRVVQPDLLLDQLAENYRQPAVRSRFLGRLATRNNLQEMVDSAALKGDVVYAADQPGAYVVLPTLESAVRVYTASIERLVKEFTVDEDDRFPDIELREVADTTVFFDRRRREGFYITSPLQVYLELARGGKREQQAAMQMRDDLLNFRYAQ